MSAAMLGATKIVPEQNDTEYDGGFKDWIMTKEGWTFISRAVEEEDSV